MKESFTLEICADCVQWLANGEVENPDPAFNPDNLADRDITLGALASECEACADGFCEPWFSWHRCDGCGSTFGGDREHATEWIA